MRATVTIHSGHIRGEVSPLIYGQYAEHVADCVYPGIWDGDSPQADDLGLRRDVQAAARELAVPVVRWPGGCFADTYHWQDGIGPRERRPVRRNWHWNELEGNQLGTDEFLRWCERIGAEPYVNLNLGTGTLDEALRWIDYCTGTEDTADVLRRKDNGRSEPYCARLWGIGNETWGSWEAGNLPADRYARICANWADFIKRYQPSAHLVGVGSAEAGDPGWDRTVLDTAGRYLDYLSNHVYAYSVDRSTGAEYLPVVFTAVYVEARLRAMADTLARYDHPIRIALDEWNIRHYEPTESGGHRLNRAGPRNVQDAIFAAGVLNAMLRMSPVVGMANYVFLVNGNAIVNVRGEQLVRTTLYQVFRRYREWMRGSTVELDVQGPGLETPLPQAGEPGHEPVLDGLPPRSGYLDAVATVDGDALAVSLVNRHPDSELTVRVNGAGQLREAWTLTHEDVYAANDFDAPERVLPVETPIPEGTREWRCPPHSVTLLRGTVRRKSRTATKSG